MTMAPVGLVQTGFLGNMVLKPAFLKIVKVLDIISISPTNVFRWLNSHFKVFFNDYLFTINNNSVVCQ